MSLFVFFADSIHHSAILGEEISCLFTAVSVDDPIEAIYNPFIINKYKILGFNSLHWPPALLLFVIGTQAILTGSVEPIQFSPAEPGAYEGS